MVMYVGYVGDVSDVDGQTESEDKMTRGRS